MKQIVYSTRDDQLAHHLRRQLFAVQYYNNVR